MCGTEASEPPMTLKHRLINEVCGREGKRVFVVTPKTNLGLNMDDLYPILMSKGFNVKVRADLGTTFDAGANGTASIMNSGIMIIEGAKSEEDAYDFYGQIVMDELKIPSSIVE